MNHLEIFAFKSLIKTWFLSLEIFFRFTMQFSEVPNMSEANQEFKVSCLKY